MKRYALWKRFSLYSIILLLIPVTAFCVLFNRYTIGTIREREQRKYRQNCEAYVRNISGFVSSIRNIAYDAIYTRVSLMLLSQALAEGENYVAPPGSASSLSTFLEAQSYATGIALFTLDGVCYLRSGIGTVQKDEIGGILMTQENPIETWSGLRLLTLEYPYNDNVPCVSYYRIVKPLRSMQPVGYCRIDVPELTLRALFSSGSTTSFLVDDEGKILSASQQSMLRQRVEDAAGQEIADQLAADIGGAFVAEIGGESYYVFTKSVYRTGWTYVSFISLDSLTYGAGRVSAMMVTLMIGCCAVFVATLVVAARLITRPLNQLAGKMDHVFSDQAGRRFPRVRQNETSMLMDSFERMKERIDHLTTTVYTSQIEELRAQLKYLQAQINPHFLYNTLDSIRFAARLNNDLSTASQIEALSDIYRSITESGTRETMGDALALARKSALLLQNQVDIAVEVHEDVDARFLQQEIPKLMIQPLMENCYLHGFKGFLGRERGNIWIGAHEQAGRFVIEVRDDGMGADIEAIMHMLSTGDGGGGSHFALKNIHSRVQIYFGKDYGIRVEDRSEGGLVVWINMPGCEEMNHKKWI